MKVSNSGLDQSFTLIGSYGLTSLSINNFYLTSFEFRLIYFTTVILKSFVKPTSLSAAF